jgi:hypothetical protein
VTHLMVLVSEGVASMVVDDFCFLVGAGGILSSGFLFFSNIACACSNRKLQGTSVGGVVLSSCVLDTGSTPPSWARGGFPNEFPLAGTMLAVLGSVLPGSLRVTCGHVAPVLGTAPVDSGACLGSGYGVSDEVL